MVRSTFVILLVSTSVFSPVAFAMNAQEQKNIKIEQNNESEPKSTTETDVSDRADSKTFEAPPPSVSAGSQAYSLDSLDLAKPSLLQSNLSQSKLKRLPEELVLLCLTFVSSNSGSNVPGWIAIRTVSKELNQYVSQVLRQAPRLVYNGSDVSPYSDSALHLVLVVRKFQMEGLKKIDLNQLKIDCVDISLLQRVVPHLTDLNLRQCTFHKPEGLFEALAQNLNLEVVALTGCWTPNDRDRRAELTNLKSLNKLRRFDAGNLLGPDHTEQDFKNMTGLETVTFIGFSQDQATREAKARIKLAHSGVDPELNYTEAISIANQIGDLALQAQAWLGLGKTGSNFTAKLIAYSKALTLASLISDEELENQAFMGIESMWGSGSG